MTGTKRSLMGQRGDGQSVLRRAVAQRPVSHPGDRGGRAGLDGVSRERRGMATNPRPRGRDAALPDRRAAAAAGAPCPFAGGPFRKTGGRRSRSGNPVFMDTREAAALVGLSPRTLDTYRSTGAGPRYYRLGGSVRYREADLEAWDAGRGRRPKRRPPRPGRDRFPGIALRPGVPGRRVVRHDA